MADRIIRGESPAGIPYERFAHTLLGINKDLLREYRLKISDSLVKQAEATVSGGKYSKKAYKLPLRTSSGKPVQTQK